MLTGRLGRLPGYGSAAFCHFELISGEPGRMFDRESELVTAFERRLSQGEGPFAQLTIAFEFDYHEGRIDVIGRNDKGELFGFEAKLNYWQKAVHQAYRNTSFTHYSYVVLPDRAARKALRSRYEFERRGIGLCSITQDGIFIEIPAVKKTPLRPWLTDSALEYIDDEVVETAVLGGNCCRLPPQAHTSPLPMNSQAILV